MADIPDNPYATPKSDLNVREAAGSELNPASAGKRIVNYLIDTLIAGVGVGYGLGMAAGWIWGYDAVEFFDRIPDFAYGALMSILYYLPLEIGFGRTLGKMVTGTKVVNEEGRKPSAGQVLGRTLCRFIPFEAFSFLGAQTRGWHDSIPKTWVVNTR